LVDHYGTRAQEIINSGSLPESSWCASLVEGVPDEYLKKSMWEKKAVA